MQPRHGETVAHHGAVTMALAMGESWQWMHTVDAVALAAQVGVEGPMLVQVMATAHQGGA